MPLIFSIFMSSERDKIPYNALNLLSMQQETFIIRAYGRTELAQCYFPHLHPQAAYRKLQGWIDYCPHQRERLDAVGANPRSRVYMPLQVRMIVEAIGEP